MKTTTIIAIASSVLAIAGACTKQNAEQPQAEITKGNLSVQVQFDDVVTKANTNYVTVLEQEKLVKKVEVMVFDKATGALNASKTLTGIDEDCDFTLPAGDKTVYAIINGPNLSAVSDITTLGGILDRFSTKKPDEGGFTLIGSADCTVDKAANATPIIKVKWMVSRVVLQKVTCNLPAQYQKMKIECVYLGNANSEQTFSGTPSNMANIDGRDSMKRLVIGKNGVRGDFPEYLYRDIQTDVLIGESCDTPYHMYCQPNNSDTYTCLYLLATIGTAQYYYRVPLKMGLTANSTCSVNLTITNLGSTNPPTGEFETGTLSAQITHDDWIAGNNYVEEF